MPERISGRAYRTTIICVDDYKGRIPAGRIFNPYIPEGESFNGVLDMLTRTEALLDSMNYPQSATVVRSFAPMQKPETEAPDENDRHGKAGTFSVRVMFRQNASWQGSVSWLEGGGEQSFRSVLELLFLIDSALSDGVT